MPDFNKFSPDTPYSPGIFSKISIQDSFVSIPDFPKLDELPDISLSGNNSVENVLGKNPFSKYKSLFTAAPAAATDYWNNRKFTSEVSDPNLFHDVGFLIGSDNEDRFAQHGKGFMTSTWDSMLRLVDKVGTSTLSTLGTIGGLIGIGNQSDQYNTGNKFKDWIAGASDNALVKWADEKSEDVENLDRPAYQEASDREKGFFKRLLTDGDFWNTDVVDGASFMLGGLGATKVIKGLTPGLRLIRGVKALQGLKYADEAVALSEAGLTGASESVSASANTILADTGEALAEGTLKGSVAAAQTVATETITPYYRKAVKSLFSIAKPDEFIDKGIITIVNTASEAMMESVSLKNDMIDKLYFQTNADGTPKYNPDQIKDIVGKQMADSFTGNLLALTFSNLWETNLFYGKGKMFSGRNIGESLIKTPEGIMGQAEIIKRTFGQKGFDYLKKLGEGVLAEGLWEENIQLAIERTNKDLNNADEGFFTKMGDYVGQMLKQTGDAIAGNDQEASLSIGLGGLMGGGMGLHQRFNEIKQIENTVKNYNDTVNFVKAKADTFYKKGADGKVLLDNGKLVLDKSKVVEYMSSMNKTLNTTELYHALANNKTEDLHKIVQNDLFSRLVKGYADNGMVDSLIANLDSQGKYSAEDLSFLGFDPSVNKEELTNKINDFKEKAVSYKNIYDSIERNFAVKIKKDDKYGSKQRAMKDTMYYLSTRAKFLTDMKNDYDAKKDLILADQSSSQFSSDSDGLVDSLNDLLSRSKAAKNRLDSLSHNQDEGALSNSNGLPNATGTSVINVSGDTSLIIPGRVSTDVAKSKGKNLNINNQRGSYVDEEELAQAHTDFENMRKEVEDFVEANKDSLAGLHPDANGQYRYKNNNKNSLQSTNELNRSRSISSELERAINATYNVYSRLSDIKYGEKYYDEVYGKRKTDLFKMYEGAKRQAVGNQKLLDYYEQTTSSTTPPDLNTEEDDGVNEGETKGANEGAKGPKKTTKKSPAKKAEDVAKTKDDLRELKEKKEALENKEELTLDDEEQISQLDEEINEKEKDLNASITDVVDDIVDNSSNIQSQDKSKFKDILNKIAKFANNVVKTDTGYLINDEPYKRVSEIINNTIPENVRPLLKGSIDAGNTIDAIVKAFFSTGLTTGFRETLNGKISSDAIDKIEKKLEQIKEDLANKGIEIVASNVIVHDPVTKVAGEIDLLAVDKNGNFKIYEIEARKGRIWHKVLNREGVGIKIADLTQNQLSAYRNLFANQYGILPNEVGVMFPIAVDIEDTPEGGFIKAAKVIKPINVVPKSVLKINNFINRTLGKGAFKGYNIFGIYANTFIPKTNPAARNKFSFIVRNVAPNEIFPKLTMKVKEAPQEFQDAYNEQQKVLSTKVPSTSKGTIELSEVIPYTQVEDNKYKPGQQLKFNQGTYEAVRIVGPEELIELISIGAKINASLNSGKPSNINKARQTQLEQQLGISAIEANRMAKELAKENRSSTVENIVLIKPKITSTSNIKGLTRHPDAPNLYALKGNKEIALYYGEELAGYMSPVPSLAYKKEDGSFGILDENTDVDTYVATTGNNAKSYQDFVNTTIAYKAAYQELMDKMKAGDGEANLTSEELSKMFDLSVNYGQLDYADNANRPLLKDLSLRGVKIGANQVITVINLDDTDSTKVIMDKAAKGKKAFTKFLDVDKWANNNIDVIKKALESESGKRRSNYVAVVELPDGSYQPISLRLNPGASLNVESDYVADLGSKFTSAVTEKVFEGPSIQLGVKGVNVTTSLSLDSSLFSQIYSNDDIEELEKLGLHPDNTVDETNESKINEFLLGLSEENVLSLQDAGLGTMDEIMDSYFNTEGFSNIEDFIENIKNCKL